MTNPRIIFTQPVIFEKLSDIAKGQATEVEQKLIQEKWQPSLPYELKEELEQIDKTLGELIFTQEDNPFSYITDANLAEQCFSQHKQRNNKVNYAAYGGFRPIDVHAYLGNVDMVKFLMLRGSETINEKYHANVKPTPLHMVKDIQTAAALLEATDIDINALYAQPTVSDGCDIIMTPLDMIKDKAVQRFLKEQGAKRASDLIIEYNGEPLEVINPLTDKNLSQHIQMEEKRFANLQSQGITITRENGKLTMQYGDKPPKTVIPIKDRLEGHIVAKTHGSVAGKLNVIGVRQ